MLALLGGCGHWVAEKSGYRLLILEQGVDLQRHESERLACEVLAREGPSNYPPTGVMHFRQCLLDKGYRLMS